jgi:hydrogenase maturation protease
MSGNSSLELSMTRNAELLILGVGNPLLSDDGVGIHVVRALQKKYSNTPGIELDELDTGGLSLAERFIGYKKVVMIDALALEGGKPGQVHRLTIDDFMVTKRQFCAHDCNLATAYNVLKDELGEENLPDEVIIIGIEIEDFDSFSEDLSAKVTKAVPKAIKLVEKELKEVLPK